MPLYRPSQLHSLRHTPNKRLSQNFLIDRNILEKILNTAEIKKGERVLEIGPGPGALTERLLEQGAEVIAIEKDPLLAHKLSCLKDRFLPSSLTIYTENALLFPLKSLLSLENPTKVVANLPYHITTPLLKKLLPLYPLVSSLTVMVQREFGERILKKTPSSQSAFTHFIEAYSSFKYCFTVKPTSFFPKPSVHSSVMQFSLKPFPFSCSEQAFFDFVEEAFMHRRKMLLSTLKERYSSSSFKESFEPLKIPLKARVEELSLEQLYGLYTKIIK